MTPTARKGKKTETRDEPSSGNHEEPEGRQGRLRSTNPGTSLSRIATFWTDLFRETARARGTSKNLSTTQVLDVCRHKNRRELKDLIDFTVAPDADARRKRKEVIQQAPSRARADRQGCTECRRFPLRAQTGVRHDRCRPEVDVA